LYCRCAIINACSDLSILQELAQSSFALPKSRADKSFSFELPEQYRDRFRVAVVTDEIPVLADHRLVVIAIMQLLDNAIKYSVPESPIDIWFGVSEAEASVTVRDQGLVIQPDDRERIFNASIAAA
jgi:signal transduction histidine kinase